MCISLVCGGAHGGQRRALDPPELELQTVDLVLDSELWLFWKDRQCASHWAISPASLQLFTVQKTSVQETLEFLSPVGAQKGSRDGCLLRLCSRTS